MFFHTKKCKHLHIGNNYPDTQYSMSLDQNKTAIKRVTSEKDLGVTFNEKLIFKKHVSKLDSRISKQKSWTDFLELHIREGIKKFVH